MSQVSHQYFGHWLQDACSTALLRQEEASLLLDPRPDWPHAADYIAAFGFSPETSPIQIVERLTIYQDFGQGSSKRARYSEMRQRLSTAWPSEDSKKTAIYFRRGSTGVARMISNEEAMIEALAKSGFEICDLSDASVPDIYRRFKHARLVVSVDGSHLNHLYFTMPQGSRLVTLIPSDRFTMNQRGYAQAAGLRYSFLVMDKDSTGYRVKIPDLLRTLDLIETAY
jgi:capsular polysaccharide biosynthesis protein